MKRELRLQQKEEQKLWPLVFGGALASEGGDTSESEMFIHLKI